MSIKKENAYKGLGKQRMAGDIIPPVLNRAYYCERRKLELIVDSGESKTMLRSA